MDSSMREVSNSHQIRQERRRKTGKCKSLIYTMGDEADDTLLSFNQSHDEWKQYDAVKNRFEKTFHRQTKRNL